MPAPVLLLTSDEQAAHVVHQVLDELGCALERPADASRAIHEIGARAFVAVLVDCDDPATCKPVLDALSASTFNRDVAPIAIVSGHTGLPNAFRLGAQFVVTKPASLDQVRHAIRSAMSRATRKESAGFPTVPAPAPALANAAAAGAASVSSDPNPPAPRPARSTSSNLLSALSMEASQVPSKSSTAGAAAAAAPAREQKTEAKPPVPPKPAASKPAAPAAAPAPKPTSDDPVLAELDELESPVAFSAPPYTKLKLRRRTPVLAFLLVMLLLAGAGGYYAFMMQPAFRDFVLEEYARVRILIGKPLPQAAPAPHPVPVPAPAPVQTAPASTTDPASSSATSTDPAVAVPSQNAAPPSPEPMAQPQTRATPSTSNPQH